MNTNELQKFEKELLVKLKENIVAIDEQAATECAKEIVKNNIDAKKAIKFAISGAAEEVGKKFDMGEYFLPQLVLAGDMMQEVGKILEASIPKDEIEVKKVVIIATIEGDMHSVGKNLVSTMLSASGFVIHDLGVDVQSSHIIQRAQDLNADIIALSSLLTTTMPYQKEVIEDLISMGLRNKFKVLIGGGPVSKEYAQEIGADGYGKDAIEAVEVAKSLI